MVVIVCNQDFFGSVVAFLEEVEEILAKYYDVGYLELSWVWEERGMFYEK